jgi:hypothetical protein
MTISELMCRLQQLPPDANVMIQDGENGGGHPRAINLGPYWGKVVTDSDSANCADCEDLVGQQVVVLGFGCY